MKIVVLTDGASHGVAILNALSAEGVVLSAIIRRQPYQSPLRKLKRFARRNGYRLAISETFRVLWKRHGSDPIRYEDYSSQVYVVADLNGQPCIDLLKQLSPDVVVLAGAPLLKPEVLQTAKIVLNAHPGLLPKYRGVDVVAWAILAGDPVGVTIHQVDAGIDTGPILLQQQVPISKGDSLANMRRKTELLCASLMAKAIKQMTAGKQLPTIVQTQSSTQSYRRMQLSMVRKVEGILRNAALLS